MDEPLTGRPTVPTWRVLVGYVRPHWPTLVVGGVLSLVTGAAFLILADLAARTVMAPAELPIGVVTAFFGAPFFALVLRSSRQVA